MYKTIKILSLGLLAITILFVLFLFFETKDEINANPTNVRKILNTFCNNKKLAGFAVSIFDADSVLYSNGFGYLDMANKQPYTTNTQQDVASISKTSIGIGLMKSVEMGLFNLDGTISYTNHAPGTNWNYSNIGAGLAAYIIEYKTGLSFAQFSHKYIFRPLKMMNTSWYKNHADSMVHTRYYKSSKVELQEVSTTGVILYPCRDRITNVKDLTSYLLSSFS